ncbi:xanthine dehydrogenase family protein subunit M [Ammoniphilus sp. YIM 78166]|uniref:FAD binding domain-containing protein n=1 Tax=Ammoniphilus sp. YIM 78166 TaxID=1644106 RepID=UPI00106F8793|nr:xanthine dehydrogenase family protein subunit M [Ammoniphilus sp. YIM 78166]
MKPAAFDYLRPSTLEEALKLLDELGDEAKVIAGGQSLVPIMNMRLATPKCLIDINQIPELRYIEADGPILRIGALTRQSELEHSPVIRERVGLMSEAIPYIGHVQTRNRGTVGGSLVHADPTAELPMTLLTLGGSVQISSLEETREVKAEEFFITYLTTDIMPNELLTQVLIPWSVERQGYAFTEFSRRHGDFALVAGACHMVLDQQGRIASGRLVLGGVDAVPLWIEEAFDLLVGENLSESTIARIQDIVEERVDPETDLHASADYRRHLAKVMAGDVLRQAYTKAKG